MGVFSVRKTTESFIEEAKNKHDNKYDYSKVDYKTTMDKIIIICPIHGMFTQTAMSHTKGFGCKKCGVDKRAKNRKSLLKEFILKSNLIHNDFYDYDNTEYKSSAEKVEINCPIHGYFKCRAGDHINKSSGCPKCKNKKLSLTIDDFILRSNDIHNNRYSYDKVEYINSYSNVIITCNEHGDFSQQPSSHLKGNGCHQCGRTISNAEIEIKKYLESHNIDCDKGKGFLDGKDVDIISKKHKICIEYNGLYWHSELFKRKEYHLNKTKLAENLGYNLIHIFEDEWKEKKNIVKSILLSKFGKIENKIYGRKCIIKSISLDECKLFLNENHLQGFVKSNVKIGCFYEDKLVAVMTFEKLRKSLGNKNKSNDQYLLNRYSCKINNVVIGGASKLLKYFINQYKPIEIISYADKRYSDGGIYNKLGFKKIHVTKPDYSYFFKNSIKRYHRFKFRKGNLMKMGILKDHQTEHEAMLENKYLRIYDCGKIKYSKIIFKQ